MLDLTWQSTFAQFTHYQTQIDNYPKLNALEPYQLQSRLENTLTRFLKQANPYPYLMILCAADVQEHHLLLKRRVQSLLPQSSIIQAQYFDELSLFGAIYLDPDNNQQTYSVDGLLHQAQDGVLILSLTQLLTQHKIWQRLKNTIISQQIHWKSIKSKQYCKIPDPIPCNIRLILIGDREGIATLKDLEPDLHQLSLFAEYEQDCKLAKENINDYLSIIKNFQQCYHLKPLCSNAIPLLMQAGARFTENQTRLPLCPLWFRSILSEADYQAKNDYIEQSDLQRAIEENHYRMTYLSERAIEDIFENQIVIETQGKKIGQINALTLLEIPGHPLTYGEPTRISCVVHFGDGDITDVERKAELGGNLHAKSMMIMQAFVNSALNLREALPYSASIVFEQSYCEIDGDSASLAKLCAFISALSMQPIKQCIALTGSVDQFGQVQAVGGINEKIEGFFDICAHRGLTGEQGVILPKANVNALSLKPEVVDAIKKKQFHLWSVEHAEEALSLLTDLPFKTKDDEQESLLDKIAQRIEFIHYADNPCTSLLSKLKDYFLSLRTK